MKILVIQLARLGDIYQTWPIFKALKRSHPGAEVHLLTRGKFAAAAPASLASSEGLIDRHWKLDTRDVLHPLIDEKPAINDALAKIEGFCSELRNEKFDRVVNLSFSPFSSFLTAQISEGVSDVRGYSRFSDGYLSIPDDASAYFYAQVGVGRPNRLHITDIFALVAGVELTEADWSFGFAPVASEDAFVVIHVGASDLGKTLSWSKWLQVVKKLCESWQDGQVVLIGSPEEAELAEKICSFNSERRPINLVGQTTLAEAFEIVREAKLLVGGDSAPVQIASLTGTTVLNISAPMVSFWETGPRSKGSRILPIESEDTYSSDAIVGEVLAMLAQRPAQLPVVRVSGPTYPFVEMRPQAQEFEWHLLRGLYMSADFPAPTRDLFYLGIRRLADANVVAMEQVEALAKNPNNKMAAQIIDHVDFLMEQIISPSMVPEAAPIVRWFRTERTRIGPIPVEQVIEQTMIFHHRLSDVLAVYLPDNQTEKDSVKHEYQGGAGAGGDDHDDVPLE